MLAPSAAASGSRTSACCIWRMPQLVELDLSDHPGGRLTDRGLDVLRNLPALRRFQMCWQSGISDTGVANLAFCEHLENVNLLGTPTGDGAVKALSGKPHLHHFRTGRMVTDAACRFFMTTLYSRPGRGVSRVTI